MNNEWLQNITNLTGYIQFSSYRKNIIEQRVGGEQINNYFIYLR